MSLIKYDPLYNQDPFAEFDRFFSRTFGDLSRWPAQWSDQVNRTFRADLYSDDDNVYVVAELPGVDRKDINIELENAVLTVSGERVRKEDERESRFTFNRSFTVGDDIQADKVKAKLENGILTVTLPKSEKRKPRQIAVG
ncbi:MAG: Hsp20/alpha crystallin family protein [Opitutales bacterium]